MLYGDGSGAEQTRKILASVVLAKSNVFQRILVVTNITRTLDKKTAIQALKKACRPCGGICEGGIYLPEAPQEVNASNGEMLHDVESNRTDGAFYQDGQVDGMV